MPRTALLILLASASALSGCGGGSEGGAAPAPPTGRAPLIERAIAAAGGRAALSAVRTLESRSIVEDGPLTYATHVQVRLPSSYRHVMEHADARFVQILYDGRSYASLDGAPYELEPDEAAAMRESLRLMGLSLLVHLDAEHGAEIEELAPKDGYERLSARFRDAPEGPYELWFRADTLRLARLAWEATFVGRRGKRQARLDLDDWRSESGIVAAWRARLFVDEAPAGENRLTALVVNPTLPDDAFAPPAPVGGEPPVVERDTAPQTVALWEQRRGTGSVADAEDKLASFIERRGLVRRGPMFRLLPTREGEHAAVGVAVVPPPSETRPSSSPSEMLHVTVRPGGRVLSLVLRRPDDSARTAALARLTAHAESRGLTPDGPCRATEWSETLLQLQLPVREKE
ncbi:MAG TPA: hypothetical protein VEI02_13780 [Planctomycetota bacterium]|nr:hypothetical protein [Planctomycetota bacterium]